MWPTAAPAAPGEPGTGVWEGGRRRAQGCGVMGAGWVPMHGASCRGTGKAPATAAPVRRHSRSCSDCTLSLVPVGSSSSGHCAQ